MFVQKVKRFPLDIANHTRTSVDKIPNPGFAYKKWCIRFFRPVQHFLHTKFLVLHRKPFGSENPILVWKGMSHRNRQVRTVVPSGWLLEINMTAIDRPKPGK